MRSKSLFKKILVLVMDGRDCFYNNCNYIERNKNNDKGINDLI